MTGYGKAECELPNKKITIEIKSLNSKQLDINARFPSTYKEKDIEVRKLIAEKMERGKVDFNLYCEQLGDSSNAHINKPVVLSYHHQMAEIMNELGYGKDSDIFNAILRLPDSVKIEHEELDENEWKAIREQIEAAIDHLNEFRVQEGIALEKDILSHVNEIISLKEQVTPFEPERMERLKDRLTEALADLSTNVQSDPNRFEQEMIYYLEKWDINEEKVRLNNHCQYFLETIAEPVSNGKKLGFISQEIGREINTMGSKANHPEIQKLVIKMKDELEKIKEQTLNIL